MDYEEQLSAAKFRAERDMARQELDRFRDDVEKRKRATAAEVQKIIDRYERICEDRKLKYEKASGDSKRRGKEIEHLCDVISSRNRELKALRKSISGMEPRLMPEGYEWPRYDTGEMVELGCQIVTSKGGGEVCGIEFNACGICVLSTEGINGEEQVIIDLENGERVKRPAVLVADREPLEAGQTVWFVEDGDDCDVAEISSDGRVRIEYFDGSGSWHDASEFVHQRPARDAGGVRIKAGDTIYSDGYKEGLVVDGYQHDGSLIAHMRDGKNYVVIRNPQHFTHTKPVSGTDGKNLLRGETVYNVVDGEECRVLGFSDCTLDVSVMGEDGSFKAVCHDVLTHTKPEIDSWERIEEDARGLDSGVDRELFTHTHEDIVRRCKALAEKENSNE